MNNVRKLTRGSFTIDVVQSLPHQHITSMKIWHNSQSAANKNESIYRNRNARNKNVLLLRVKCYTFFSIYISVQNFENKILLAECVELCRHVRAFAILSLGGTRTIGTTRMRLSILKTIFKH